MTDKPIDVSIIIPVFNTEKYLAMCLESVTAQEGNIEIILINDGSNDRSPEICREFNKKDNRIIVIDQQNSGVSTARNKGIECACGKYIMFVDSDDTIDKCMISELMVLAKNNDFPDLIFSGFVRSSRQNKINTSQISKTGLFSGNKMYEFLSEIEIVLLSSPWCKLFKRSIIENFMVRFDTTIKLQEDLKFNYDFLDHAKNIYVSDKIYYTYNVNPGGSANFKGDIFINNACALIKTEDAFWAKRDPSVRRKSILEDRAFNALFGIYSIYRIPQKKENNNIKLRERIIWLKKYINFAEQNIPSWTKYFKSGIPKILAVFIKRRMYYTIDAILLFLFKISHIKEKQVSSENF